MRPLRTTVALSELEGDNCARIAAIPARENLNKERRLVFMAGEQYLLSYSGARHCTRSPEKSRSTLHLTSGLISTVFLSQSTLTVVPSAKVVRSWRRFLSRNSWFVIS